MYFKSLRILEQKIGWCSFDVVWEAFAGDWNFIFDATMDSFGKKAKLKLKAIFELQNIMSSYELFDIWRTRNPTLRQFTWRRKNPLQMSRIDYILIYDDLQYAVKSCEFLCPLSSDHSPVKLKSVSKVL